MSKQRNRLCNNYAQVKPVNIACLLQNVSMLMLNFFFFFTIDTIIEKVQLAKQSEELSMTE